MTFLKKSTVYPCLYVTELRDSFAQDRSPPAIFPGTFLYFFLSFFFSYSAPPLYDFSALTHAFRTVCLFLQGTFTSAACSSCSP